MLECFNESDKYFPVRRQRVRNGSPWIFFVDESGMNKAARMLRNGFKVSIGNVGYAIHGDTGMTADYSDNFNSPMVGNTLEVPL